MVTGNNESQVVFELSVPLLGICYERVFVIRGYGLIARG
jgi:hypothetical protein